jgi:hypothetical protein
VSPARADTVTTPETRVGVVLMAACGLALKFVLARTRAMGGRGGRRPCVSGLLDAALTPDAMP